MIAVGGKAFRWSDYRYRVVSLEIMKKIDVGRLFDYSAGLTRCAGYPSIWNRLASELTPGVSVEAVLREPDVKRKYVDYLSGIGAACLDADLANSVAAVNRLIDRFESGMLGQADLESQYREVRTRMEDELRARTFLQIETPDARLYEQPLEQWQDVIAHFPSCQR